MIQLFSVVLLLCINTAVYAQDFKGQQKKQEKLIKATYKQKKITELEYNKLMREQEIIKQTMDEYAADDIWTSKEKNAIHAKLERAEKRLKKYKTNNEIY